MRKNLTTAVAVLASVLFVGAALAEAGDNIKTGYAGWTSDTTDSKVKMGGQIWTRYESNGQNAYNPNTGNDQSISSRIRLDADAKINDSTSAFIQLQAVRTWGDDTTGIGGPRGTTASPAGATNTGSGNAAVIANDQDATVGVHQAYVKVKSFFTLPIDLKLGRQEIVLDGHRLFGNVWWTMGGRSHDAAVVSHAHGDNTFVYAFSKGGEGGRTATTGDVNDQYDINVHAGWANLKNLLHANSGLSIYAVAVDSNGFTLDPASSNTLATNAGGVFQNGLVASNNIYNFGFRQEGKEVQQLWGIDYRGEFYYQTGMAESDAARAGSSITGVAANNYYTSQGVNTGVSSDISRRAYMYGIRVGKTFKDVSWKPNATIWYDHLSGTNDDDVQNRRFGSFNTLFHTGHKYYGFMDNFVASTSMGTNYLGLRDLAGKFSIQPLDSVKFSLDMHAFWTDTNLADNQGIRTALGIPQASAANGNHLGEELDLTLAHKYNANVNLTAGYSHFWADDLFHAVSGQVNARAAVAAAGASNANAGGADWVYVMMDVLF